MTISRVWSVLAIGASATFWGLAAQAQAPGLYYAWRSINGDLTACLNRSTAALTSQELDNIQVEGNSVAGTTADSTAVFVCLESLDTTTVTTTVMIMVSSNNDDVAFELRETLKESF
ncbi:MAG: hypothetical protein ACFB12_12685 [Leptolyngbyaceae cyanobacterium]